MTTIPEYEPRVRDWFAGDKSLVRAAQKARREGSPLAVKIRLRYRTNRASHSQLRSHSISRYLRQVHSQRSYYEAPVTQDIVDDWFLSLEEEVVDSDEIKPSERVVEEAKRIVRRVRKELPLDTDVYHMEEGKVAIELYGDLGHGFLLMCEPGGSAVCIVTVDGVSRRARYENSSSLPDGFLFEGLRDVRSMF